MCFVNFFLLWSTYGHFATSACLMIDRAHLKGGFKGTMLLVVAMGRNNQIMSVSYRIAKNDQGAQSRSHGSYKKKLHYYIGDLQPLTFISDRASSIVMSIANIFRMCIMVFVVLIFCQT